MQKRDQDPSAARTNRVSESDSSPMPVDAILSDAKLPDHGERLRGKGLVELEHIDIAQL